MGFLFREEANGNLWSATCPLVLCVNEDYDMRQGMPLIFGWHFGFLLHGLNESERVKVGEIKLCHRIYCLVTKKKADDLSTYEALEACLNALKKRMIEEGHSEIAMPRLACGRMDGLAWSKVKALILNIFAGTDITITVYSPPFKQRLCPCCRKCRRSPMDCRG